MFGSKKEEMSGEKSVAIKKFKPYSPKSSGEVYLGMEVRNIISNFQGIVSSVRQLVSGQIQFCIEPKGDGTTVPDAFFSDWQTMEIIGEGIQDRVSKPDGQVKIKLGQTVRHTVNGFTGVAAEKITYINGCVSFWVIPTEEYQKQFPGKLLSGQALDHHMLEVVGAVPASLAEKAAIAENPPVVNKPTGGPSMRANHRMGRIGRSM
jgi:hypothetical protein